MEDRIVFSNIFVIGDDIYYLAAPGEVNELSVGQTGHEYYFDESGGVTINGIANTSGNCSHSALPSSSVSLKCSDPKTLHIATLDMNNKVSLGGIILFPPQPDAGFGENSPAWIYGGDGNDEIDGGAGVDHLFGDGGLDTIRGGTGGDRIFGGGGADLLRGDDDLIYGGSGNDVLTGGAGFDSFAGGAGYDEVTDREKYWIYWEWIPLNDIEKF